MTAERDWLDPSELRTWVALTAVMESLPAAIDRQLRDDSDINLFEYTVLAMLSEQPDRTTAMSELASLSFASLSRLSHAISRLEQRGWVERRAGAGGRRHTVVSLRPAGVEAIEVAAPGHVANVRELVFDPLSRDEAATLGALLVKLLSRANPELSAQFDDLLTRVIERNQACGEASS